MTRHIVNYAAELESLINPNGSPQLYWRANRSSYYCIWATCKSSHLVAGPLRGVPRDSYSYPFYNMKRIIKGICAIALSANYRTSNV